MFKVIKQSGWLVGGLIFFMPVLFIFFLGSQMAYSQVKGQFETYQNIPEATTLAQLQTLPADQLVILRGQISPATLFRSDTVAPDLIIFQERPAEGREVRYQEEFPLIFPEFVMALPDGQVIILPSLTRDRVIQAELHAVTAGDRQRTGFRLGDTVSVQGQWQPNLTSGPTLNDATGITSADKHDLIVEWQDAFRKVGWVRDGLGLLSLLGLILLIVQLRRTKANRENTDEWQTPTTKTAPIT